MIEVSESEGLVFIRPDGWGKPITMSVNEANEICDKLTELIARRECVTAISETIRHEPVSAINIISRHFDSIEKRLTALEDWKKEDDAMMNMAIEEVVKTIQARKTT